MEGGGHFGGMSSGTKPSKASLTSVSACRKTPDKSVPYFFILKKTSTCYRMADVCVSLLLIFPIVIGFWRGVWNLSENFSKYYGIDPWMSIIIGYLIPFLLYWLQEPLKRTVQPQKMNFFLFYVISRSLLLVHSFGSVNQWRGLWELLDLQTGIELSSALCSLIVGVVFSILLKTFCNVLAPPLYVVVDDHFTIHDCPTRFRTSPKLKFSYFLDCIVSVFVAASLIVVCWRGLWALADLWIYPNDKTMSSVTSLAFGYGVVLLLFILQPCIHKCIDKLQGFSHLMFANLVTFIGFVGCVFSWRGVWMLYDDVLCAPNWLTTVIGALGSLVLGCISTVIVRGVAVDGEVSDDGGSDWPIPYISLIQTSIHDVPFPEPWLFRYFCTNQKMNCHAGKGGTKEKNSDGTITKKSVHTVADINQHESFTLYPSKSKVGNNSNTTDVNLELKDLQNLRNIDSSSDEDVLGSRFTMTIRKNEEENCKNGDETRKFIPHVHYEQTPPAHNVNCTSKSNTDSGDPQKEDEEEEEGGGEDQGQNEILLNNNPTHNENNSVYNVSSSPPIQIKSKYKT